MAKFSYKSKLTKEEQEEFLMDLCDAISSVKNSREAAQFLKDLLSPQEAEMLAKRVKVAELLLAGWSYKRIIEYLKVSEGTVARISEWLKLTGNGYRMIIARLKEKRKGRLKIENKSIPKEGMQRIEEMYPTRFWPKLLIQGLIKNSQIKNKNKILESLAELKLKPQLYRRIEKEFNNFN